MNTHGKKIEVNASSLLDLKAELIRKQDEYRRSKLENGNVIRPKPAVKKPNIWSKQNTGVTERGKADLHYEETPEEQDALKKSREALEAKAKLYDRLTSGLVTQDKDQTLSYLVNFEQKVINNIKEKKLEEENKKNESQTVEEELAEEIPASCPEEEWVDYVDSLGRSRRCLRKDLSNLLEMDRKLGVPKPSEPGLPVITDPKQIHLLSDDIQRELRRKKWDEEAEEALSKPVGPVHYQTVQHEEIRDHGIGYFAFSQDELERKKQLDSLNNLRQQTQDQRNRREILKQKRKEQLKSRLAKVKQRQKQKLGIEGSSSDDDESNNLSGKEDEGNKTIDNDSTETTIGPQPKSPEEAKVPKIRPWDKGKIGVRVPSYKPPGKKLMTQDEWVEKQRSDRQADFAPPQFYYDSKPNQPFPNVDFSRPPPFFAHSTSSSFQPFAQPFTTPSSDSRTTPSPPIETMHCNPMDSIPLPADPEPAFRESDESIEERVSAMLAFYKAKSSSGSV